MPRKARKKYPDAIFHIMCRSQSEFLLFRDDGDKDYYLGLLKRYTDKYQCSLYAYCLMDNHLHLHFDPRGFDISKFMQCINTAYVRYYNKKYNRHGHVFQERFESRILDTDEYNLAVSAYIHNNAKDVGGYIDREEEYKYSSYGIYLGLRKDELQLIVKSFILEMFSNSGDKFRERYSAFVSQQRDSGNYRRLKEKLSSAVENEYVSGRKIIARDMAPSKVISYISERLMIPVKCEMIVKRSRRLSEFKAFSVYALRVLCDMKYSDICKNVYNITISGCSRLSNKGYTLLETKHPIYVEIFEGLIKSCA